MRYYVGDVVEYYLYSDDYSTPPKLSRGVIIDMNDYLDYLVRDSVLCVGKVTWVRTRDEADVGYLYGIISALSRKRTFHKS